MKRPAEEQIGPKAEDGEGDPDMGVPLATESTLVNIRKREADTGEEVSEPAAVRPRLENLDVESAEFDISELFSPPRVSIVAEEAGLRGGYCLDKTCVDHVTGKSWDLNRQRDQAQLWGLLRRRPTRLLIASPPCTTFSSLQRLRKTAMPEAERLEGLELLKVAVKACQMQAKSGNLFLLEHPAGASSWKVDCLMDLSNMNGVQSLVLDQCMYGLVSADREGSAPARKSTRILTNMLGAERFLTSRCDHGHRHVELLNNRAKAAQEYPRELCQAFVNTFKFHSEIWDAHMLEVNEKQDEMEEINGVSCEWLGHDLDECGELWGDLPELLVAEGELREPEVPPGDDLHEAQGPWCDYNFVDENTGRKLDPLLVKKGDDRELAKLRGREVYDYAPRGEAKLGKLIKTRWARSEKGAEVRSRFVAQEFAHGDPRDDLFASTPPLFAARLVVSLAATRRTIIWNLMALDIACAFLYAEAERQLYIEIPAGDPRARDPNVIGRLRKALYGTRDAPLLWQKTLSRSLAKLGFRNSRLQPGFYMHQKKELALVTHVDDFLVAGTDENLDWFKQELKKMFEISGEKLGDVSAKTGKVVTEIKFLGRTIKREPDGLSWEADRKHVSILLEEHGMVECKPVDLPLTKGDSESHSLDRDALESMGARESTQFRRSVARLNYLSLDRPDIGIAVNKLARCMAHPKAGDEMALKRLLRYLQGAPRCLSRFPMQSSTTSLVAMSDSDWAGCRTTRKSTSGIAVFLGQHLLSFASRLQKSVALSSGEAELVAQTSGIADALGVRNLLFEFGFSCGVTSLCDSSAARGILNRSGVGRIKHLELRHLWVQGFVQTGVVHVRWIPRAQNPADVLTHATSAVEFWKHMSELQLQFPSAQFPATALQCVAEGGVLEFCIVSHSCLISIAQFLTFGCNHSRLVVSCGSRKNSLQAPSSFMVAERRSLCCYC